MCVYLYNMYTVLVINIATKNYAADHLLSTSKWHFPRISIWNTTGNTTGMPHTAIYYSTCHSSIIPVLLPVGILVKCHWISLPEVETKWSGTEFFVAIFMTGTVSACGFNLVLIQSSRLV